MDVATKIETFNILFYVSMAVTILGLGMSIYFFFHYDIPSVWAFLTGSAKRKAIEEMNERNRRQGGRRSSSTRKSSGGGPGAARHSDKKRRPVSRSASPRMEETDFVQSPQTEQNSQNETDILTGSAETDVLTEVTETEVLTAAAPGSTPHAAGSSGQTDQNTDSGNAATEQLSISIAPASVFRFEITENTLVIHTDEYI